MKGESAKKHITINTFIDLCPKSNNRLRLILFWFVISDFQKVKSLFEDTFEKTILNVITQVDVMYSIKVVTSNRMLVDVP